MRNIIDIIRKAAVLLGIAVLAIGCQKDDRNGSEGMRNVMVSLDISSGGMTKATEAATDQEKIINSIRVYAFAGERMVGHYYRESITPSTTFSLVMDIEMFKIDDPVANSQSVDFYVIANEGAMTLATGTAALSSTTKEADLWQMKYTAVDESKGIPMYYTGTHAILLDSGQELDPESSTDMTGHEGHVISQKLNLTLTRPIAKVELYAAKEASIGSLNFSSVSLSNPATLGYTFPSAALTGITYSSSSVSMLSAGTDVTKVLDPTSPTVNLSDHTNYQKVGEAIYLLENPAGSDIWNIQTSAQGSVLTISYTKEGATETGIVYMPAIERNTSYKICCLVRAVRDVVIRFEVSDWASETVNVPEYN